MEATTKPEEFPSLGINDLLSLLREIKDTIIEILKNDDVSTISVAQMKAYNSCCISISISDEDLLLRSKLHNRPLFVSGYVWELKLNRILIDNGSGVNILSKSTINQLDISIKELSSSKLVNADTKPFSEVESHFVDAKFYTKSDDISEVVVAKDTYKLEQRMITTKKSNEVDAPNGREIEPTIQVKSEVPENKNMESFTTPLTKMDKEEAKRIEKEDVKAFL
ncbi:ty3-gypsy retrotransposon protein [Cucumis melo var. makuwa]|uniref:Ty3-gypsy retrotransposon protein n=1 Tax=Cucumis melo var. makuwa TaxID=1194695 RepID=A0A5A7TDU2_CUCMM|nr:ty3-gypsy retrotransposon protein [Cucumis melo var. makuwa]